MLYITYEYGIHLIYIYIHIIYLYIYIYNIYDTYNKYNVVIYSTYSIYFAVSVHQYQSKSNHYQHWTQRASASEAPRRSPWEHASDGMDCSESWKDPEVSWLVGGWQPTPLKNRSSSIGMMIVPNRWKDFWNHQLDDVSMSVLWSTWESSVNWDVLFVEYSM